MSARPREVDFSHVVGVAMRRVFDFTGMPDPWIALAAQRACRRERAAQGLPARIKDPATVHRLSVLMQNRAPIPQP